MRGLWWTLLLGGCALPVEPEPGPPPPEVEPMGPREVAPALMLAAGRDQLCALESTGAVRCLGQGPPPPALPFQDVSVGAGLACGLRLDGSIDCWGPEDPYGFADELAEMTRERPALEVALGYTTACAVFPEGIECIGEEYISDEEGAFHGLAIGRWGLPTEIESRCVLDEEGMLYCDQVESLGLPTHQSFKPIGEGPFVEVIGTNGGLCALREDGTCWTLGFINDDEARLWQDLAQFSFRTCGVTLDGELLCWDAQSRKTRPFSDSRFVDVDLWGEWICAIDVQGAVLCQEDL
jgi:hypothetical protein